MIPATGMPVAHGRSISDIDRPREPPEIPHETFGGMTGQEIDLGSELLV
jgi:hypothetical protein